MKSQQLRNIQRPLKDRYKLEPQAARITLKASGSIDDQDIACNVETGRALRKAGLHTSTGGTGMLACSGDMLLEALVACAGVTLKAVATAMGINLARAAVIAEGDLDVRGTLGVSADAQVGFEAIRLRFEVESDASPETLATLVRLTERYCVVFQTLRTPARITMDLVAPPSR